MRHARWAILTPQRTKIAAITTPRKGERRRFIEDLVEGGSRSRTAPRIAQGKLFDHLVRELPLLTQVVERNPGAVRNSQATANNKQPLSPCHGDL
jgi:hypothetical protein